MRANIPCVLSIAGSDSSGGAGIQADIKAISATGSYAASVITALTAQNTMGVQAVQSIPADFIEAQLSSVFDDLNVEAVKIGMLYNQEVIAVVADALHKYKPRYVVLDPVMISKSGHALLESSAIQCMQENLFSYATLITPNAVEVESLLGMNVRNSTQQMQAAKTLGEKFNVNVLVKGGHVETEQAADVLYLHANATTQWFYAPKITSNHTHGTGCTLSSAIASMLAQSRSLPCAIQEAKQYLTKAILSAQKQKIGHGHGPVDHFYFLKNKSML